MSDRTRARVVAHARARGWRPNATARALSTGRSAAIGICLGREPELLSVEAYYPQLLVGIEEVLLATSYSLLVRMAGSDPAAVLKAHEDWVRESRVDGIILCDMVADDPRVALMEKLGFPAVIQGEYRGTSLPVVSSDVEQEARALVEHFAERGFAALVMLSGPQELVHERARVGAVRRQAARLGLSLSVHECHYEPDDGRQMAESVVARAPADAPATAVLCSNDRMAAGFIAAWQAMRPTTPLVGVASWDDSQLCELLQPAITALSRSPRDLGRRAAESLLALLGDAPGRSTASDAPETHASVQVRASSLITVA